MNRTTQQPGHQYGTIFYRYQREGSLRSAHAVLPLVVDACSVSSLFDIGCGAGAWLAVAKSLGLKDFAGADGDYLDRSTLLIDAADFSAHDITKRFDVGRTFDLVLCLEVAEHVPTESSTTLVDNIVRHGPLVLFSAAVPGQGGEDHINEQNYAYWRDLFALHGYRLFDFVRPRIADRFDVEPWYRYNLMLFAHDAVIARLPKEVTRTRVADNEPIHDVSPWLYRLRKTVLTSLPVAVVSWLAARKHRHVVRAMRQRN